MTDKDEQFYQKEYEKLGGKLFTKLGETSYARCLSQIVEYYHMPFDVNHRIDGPAVIFHTFSVWFYHGIDITASVHEFMEEMNMDRYNLTEDDKTILALMIPTWASIKSGKEYV